MKPNMNDNFKLLEERVLDTLSKTDLLEIQRILKVIKEPTLCTGVGGSHVVSTFVSKAISSKNNCIVENVEPRDMSYKNLCGYKNVIACSYSGANIGVQASFNNVLTKYLLSTVQIDNINNLTYKTSLPKEDSFISLAATLMPMAIILAYYLDNDITIIKDILSHHPQIHTSPNTIYEIFSGYETSSASSFLSSTFTEAGLTTPLLHDKYSYCHGRSTASHHSNNSAIYLDQHTELDRLLLSVIPEEYKNLIILSSKYKDPIINDFYLTYQSMYLAKSLAEETNKDLSRVDYSPLVKKLYYYQGEL